MNCYAQEKSKVCNEIKASDSTNMTERWLILFRFGFIIQLVTLSGLILIALSDRMCCGCVNCFRSCLHYPGWIFFLGGFFILNLIWFVVAFFLRYRQFGQIISGSQSNAPKGLYMT